MQEQDFEQLVKQLGEKKAEKIKKMLSIAIDETSKYSTPVIYPGAYPEKTSEVGSGTYVIISGKKGILTNWHVADNFMSRNVGYITIPFSDTQSMQIRYECIIKLHPQNIAKGRFPDIAFIKLHNSDLNKIHNTMDILKKCFFNLDIAKNEYNENPFSYDLNGELNIIHGSIMEGKRTINNRKTIFFPKAGSQIVVPDNLQKICLEYPGLGLIEMDTIDCPIRLKERSRLAKSFIGMSGAALWSLTFDKDSYISKIKLLGIATIQKEKEDKIICQGPLTLYKLFYPLCLKYF